MRRIPLEQRRDELVAAAIRVISREGLAAATTRAIVAEADMPLGAFHYAFGSRDDLLAAVIDEVTDAERLAALTGAAVGDPSDEVDLETILRAGLSGYLRYLESSPSSELALFEVALHAVRHDPEAVRRQWQTYRNAAADALEHAADLARIRWKQPVDELAHFLTRSLDGLTLTWLADRDGAAARLHIAFLAASFTALAEPREAQVMQTTNQTLRAAVATSASATPASPEERNHAD